MLCFALNVVMSLRGIFVRIAVHLPLPKRCIAWNVAQVILAIYAQNAEWSVGEPQRTGVKSAAHFTMEQEVHALIVDSSAKRL